MEVELTQEQERHLKHAADITEIQSLMNKYIRRLSQMDVAGVYEELFAQGDDEVSVELADSGIYVGPKQVDAFFKAYDEYLADPSDKRGYMEMQDLCTPYIMVNKKGTKGMATWSVLTVASKWAMPYPCDKEALTAIWGLGKYLVDFVKQNGTWRIKKLKLLYYVRSPYDTGWLKQPDCYAFPVLKGVKPDAPSEYAHIYGPDYVCASGGIEWGPYMPEESVFEEEA